MAADDSASAKGLEDGTVLITAHGQQLIIRAGEVKELMKQLALSLAEVKIAEKRRPRPPVQ